jgi:retinol dehydrogenase-12
MGMDVWIGVRGEERAARVAKEIEQEAEKELEKEREKRKKNGDSEGLKQLPKNSGKVFGRDLDLSSFASIKRFASSVATHQDKIDLLVNNAGIMNTPYGLTTDGFEIQMGTNHFGHFYLTQLLLPKILKAGKSRILNVSSVAFWAAGGGIDYESQLNPITYNPMKAYGMSKLLNIYFTRSLHQRYHSLGVNSTCLHPGSVNTELTKHSMSDILKRLGYPVIFCFFKTAKEGAQNSLHCALANDIVSGSYYCDTRRIELEGAPADAKAAEEWWNRSEKMVKEIVDKIEQNKETK